MKKSVKAQKLENEYNEKIETTLLLYKNFNTTWFNKDRAIKEVKTIAHDFSDCLSLSFNFGLISKKDFEALWNDIIVNGKYNYCNTLDIIYNMEV